MKSTHDSFKINRQCYYSGSVCDFMFTVIVVIWLCASVCAYVFFRAFPIFTPIMWFTETLRDKMFCSRRMPKSNWVWHIDTSTAVSQDYLHVSEQHSRTITHIYTNHITTSRSKVGGGFHMFNWPIFSMSQLTSGCLHSSIKRSVEGTPSSVLLIGWLRRSSPVMRTLRPHMITGYLITLG